MHHLVAEASLSSLILSLSSLTAGSDDEIGAEIAERLAAHFRGSRVEIALRTRAGKVIASESVEPLTTEVSPFVVFDRPVSIRGRHYGQLRVELADPATPPAATIQALETVAQLLGLFAERLSLLEEHQRLGQHTEDLSTSLYRDKIIARARGIVAAERGISLREAERWLEQQARRARRPLLAFADRLILHQSHTRLLRRTA